MGNPTTLHLSYSPDLHRLCGLLMGAGDYQSPILGGRVPSSTKEPLAVDRDTATEVVQPAFQSEDSDILAHNANIQTRRNLASPRNYGLEKVVNSSYSWSPSPPPQPPPKGTAFPLSLAVSTPIHITFSPVLLTDRRKHLRKTTSQEDGARSDNRDNKHKSQTSKIKKQVDKEKPLPAG